nr:hypothetical transcript [Hymenolepis microstoma]
MIATVLVLVPLLIDTSLGKENLTLLNRTCSRIVSTPNKETEPLIIQTGGKQTIYAYVEGQRKEIEIKDGICSISAEERWKPCHKNQEYLNITMKDAPKFDQLEAFGNKFTCIINFVPKCAFKSVPSHIMLETSFPFIRFGKGRSSVTIHFSIRGSNFDDYISLQKGSNALCVWRQATLFSGANCQDATVNTTSDSLDYTHVYQRVNMETLTTLGIYTDHSRVGVTIDWTKEGVSPDVIECEKYSPQTSSTPKVTTTSSGCVIGSVLVVLIGTIQWSFE